MNRWFRSQPRAGANTIIGHEAPLFAHAIHGRRLSPAAIRLGNEVGIRATAAIMSDVIIGDGVSVSVGAVVTKGTRASVETLYSFWRGPCIQGVKKPLANRLLASFGPNVGRGA